MARLSGELDVKVKVWIFSGNLTVFNGLATYFLRFSGFFSSFLQALPKLSFSLMLSSFSLLSVFTIMSVSSLMMTYFPPSILYANSSILCSLWFPSQSTYS
jgi:hypothetical protein